MPSVKTKLLYDKQYMRILAGVEVMLSSIVYIDWNSPVLSQECYIP